MKQGVNKSGNTVLYLVFEYMETDVKKFIRSYRSTGDNIPPKIVKVPAIFCVFISLGILFRVLFMFTKVVFGARL